MLFLFVFAAAALFTAMVISLSEINPFRPKALPMLEQIELARSDYGYPEEELDQLQLAA